MILRLTRGGLAAFALMLGIPGLAFAHAELASAEPEPGAVLPSVPPRVTLTFDGELDPDGSEMVVTGPDGSTSGTGGVDLDVAERNVLIAELGGTGDGEYRVAWTAQSEDGYVERGTHTFRVGSPAGASAPDTALPRTVPLAPIGAALLAVALMVAARVRRLPGALLVVALIAAGCVADPAPANCEADSATIELELEANALTPNDPAVCRDQEVSLEIASDADGVLHVHGYDEALPASEVEAGTTTTLSFTAIRSGQFPIEFHAADDPAVVEIGVLTVREP